MGQSVPRPIECTIVERHRCNAFNVGIAEMNGWRSSMEDAHLVYMRDDWGLFGVFDGHGGPDCSKFIAMRLAEELDANGCPRDDEDVKALLLDLDEQFLETQLPGGSTGTMCIIHKPQNGGKHHIRVINVGDSRVLLGRRDGTIVDGGGTDQGLTTDHKPDAPSEKERIQRTGGFVHIGPGSVARVNGDLAVSRSFGDAGFKRTGPTPEEQPVTANPEMSSLDCEESDFVLLVCDGVSEGDFSNPEVVALAAEYLRDSDDVGAAAKAICHKALDMDSKDNITCMIVSLKGCSEAMKEVKLIPGPMLCPDNHPFLTAYAGMAQRAGLSLAQACEMRYESILESLETADEDASRLKAELREIGTPPGEPGSEERAQWFREWEQNKMAEDQNSEDFPKLHGIDDIVLAEPATVLRVVKTPGIDVLRNAVRDHGQLRWYAWMRDIGESEGEVIQVDEDDGTSKVRFVALNNETWLPTDILEDTE